MKSQKLESFKNKNQRFDLNEYFYIKIGPY